MATQRQAKRSTQPDWTAQAGGGVAADPAAAGRGGWRRLTGYVGAHKLEFATLVVSLLGLAVSIYLTIEHLSQSSNLLLCPENATFNCVRVTTSPESKVFGIFPVAELGLAFFIFMVVINSPWGWRARQPLVHWARLGSVVVGMIFVLYLIYAELFLVKAICLYCTAVHVLTFILFGMIMTRVAASGVKAVPATR
jgi:uncharacterized membrane protein